VIFHVCVLMMVCLVLLLCVMHLLCLVSDKLTLKPLQPGGPLQGPYIKRVAIDIVKRHVYCSVVHHMFEAWIRNGENVLVTNLLPLCLLLHVYSYICFRIFLAMLIIRITLQ
jgi:hypothetical protein